MLRSLTLYGCCIIVHLGFCQVELICDKQFEPFAETPGAMVAVYKDGEISFSKGYGMANLNYNIPITSKTVFDIGSVSKQFTAACIFLLEQQGKLSIDDPIQKWLPEMPTYNNDIIKIRNLINHNSGLRDYVEIVGYAGKPFNNLFTEEMGLDIMARQQEPNFKPGEKFMYNNGGYLLLAIIVRRASGMSIGEYAQAQIFEPLGMTSTFILENPNRIIKNGATGYNRLKDGKIEELHYKNVAIGGDGQVYTTIEDLLLWDNNFYNPKVGGKPLLNNMQERGLLNSGDTLTYAGGLFIETYKGHRLVQHTGAWGGFIAAFYRLPELHTSVVMLSNYRPTFTPAAIFAVLDVLIPEPAPTKEKPKESKAFKVNRKSLPKYVGLFEVIGEPQKRFRIFVENDSLNVEQYWTKQKFTLKPISEGKFIHSKLSYIEFDFNTANHCPTIQEPISEMRTQRVDSFSPIENLEAYQGNYYSEEVEATYSIQAKGGQLLIKRNKDEIYTLDQVSSDVFGEGQVGFQFTRSNGEINAFLLQDRRIRNLKFKKTK